MKVSILISLVILFGAALLTWSIQGKVSTLEASRAEIVSEAQLAGITLEQADRTDASRSLRPPREDNEGEAKVLASDFIAFAQEMKSSGYDGSNLYTVLEGKMGRIMARLMSLDAKQLKTFIVETEASEYGKERFYLASVCHALFELSQKDPEATLSIFSRFPQFGIMEVDSGAVSTAICKIAETDPAAALDWMRDTASKNPTLISDGVKRGFAITIAKEDMRAAFDFMEEFPEKDPGTTLNYLVQGATKEEKRGEFLGLFREKLKAMPEGGTRDSSLQLVFMGLAGGLAREDFQDSVDWLSKNNMSAEELDAIAPSLGYGAKSSDKGKWIIWMGDNLAGRSRNLQIESVVRDWTSNDYRAAGKWLAQAPDGPAKLASVSSYAKTVARKDPATATQWALTLPEGDLRKATIMGIHKNWPNETEGDSADREAFRTAYRKYWDQ